VTRAGLYVIALAVLLSSGAAWGADTLSDRAAAIERSSTEPDGMRVVLGHISRKLAIPVEKLRTEHQQTGLGWGDLFIAHRLVNETRLTVEQLAGELRAGKTWDEIARAHKVDPAPLITELQQSQDAIDRRAEDKSPNPMTLSGPGTGQPSASGLGGAGPQRRY